MIALNSSHWPTGKRRSMRVSYLFWTNMGTVTFERSDLRQGAGRQRDTYQGLRLFIEFPYLDFIHVVKVFRLCGGVSDVLVHVV